MAKKSKKAPAKPSKPVKKAASDGAAAPGVKSAFSSKLEALKRKFLPSKPSSSRRSSRRLASDTVSSPKSAREIVAEQMPGMRILSEPLQSNSDAVEHATAHGAGLDALRQHYLEAPQADAVSETPGDSEVVMVEPVATDAAKRGPGPKAVIVSNGRIVGRQG
jgi:hypothetical protein